MYYVKKINKLLFLLLFILSINNLYSQNRFIKSNKYISEKRNNRSYDETLNKIKEQLEYLKTEFRTPSGSSYVSLHIEGNKLIMIHSRGSESESNSKLNLDDLYGIAKGYRVNDIILLTYEQVIEEKAVGNKAIEIKKMIGKQEVDYTDELRFHINDNYKYADEIENFKSNLIHLSYLARIKKNEK